MVTYSLALMECTDVQPGLFDDEQVVTFLNSEGKEGVFITSGDQIRRIGDKSFFQVVVLDEGEATLVQLPSPSLTMGLRLWANPRHVRKEAV